MERTSSPRMGSAGAVRATPASALVLPIALALGLGLGACSGPERSGPVTTSSAPTTATPTPRPASFTIGMLDLQAVGAEARLPDEVRAGLQSTLDRYLDRAVLSPLRTGGPAGDLSALFTEAVMDRLTGPDRHVLVDEGLGPAPGAEARVATADLTVLMGPDGVAVVVASVNMTVTGTAAGAHLSVERAGELMLVNGDGGWRVGGYDVTATRELGGAVTTTTARR